MLAFLTIVLITIVISIGILLLIRPTACPMCMGKTRFNGITTEDGFDWKCENCGMEWKHG